MPSTAVGRLVVDMYQTLGSVADSTSVAGNLTRQRCWIEGSEAALQVCGFGPVDIGAVAHIPSHEMASPTVTSCTAIRSDLEGRAVLVTYVNSIAIFWGCHVGRSVARE